MQKMYETIQKSCMGLWKQIHKFLNSLDNYFENSQYSHLSQNFCKMLGQFIMFIEKNSLVVTTHQNSGKTCTIFA